jgi:hypothetical protein
MVEMVKYCNAPVAQRIEQDGSNVKVGGSIPFGRANFYASIPVFPGRNGCWWFELRSLP